MEVRVLFGALEHLWSSVTEYHADRPSAELRAVLDVSEGVLQDLDVEVVLSRVLEAARELTSARYAAVRADALSPVMPRKTEPVQ